jgi:hypothetical protein
MNYQDYIKYDPEKKQYTDSYGYVIDGFSSKVLPTELNTAGEAIAIANGAVATANAAAASIAAVNNGNFQTVTAGYGLNNQLTITTNNAGVATIVPTGTSSNIDVIINPKGGDGCLKVGSNFSKCVALVANDTAKVSTMYSSSASANLTLESKGPSGKIVFTNYNNGNTFESLDITHANGTSTCTTANIFPASYPNGDIILVPRGFGIVDCKSYTAEYNTGMGSTQTLGTNVNTKVRFDNSIMNNFPAGFITAIDLGGWVYDTFQNTSGRTIALMVTACIRETTFPTGRTLGLWIARTGDSSLRYGQALLPPTTDTTNGRALNTASIIRLANTESFSVWAHTVADGVVIGGNGQLYNRPILSFRLIP